MAELTPKKLTALKRCAKVLYYSVPCPAFKIEWAGDYPITLSKYKQKAKGYKVVSAVRRIHDLIGAYTDPKSSIRIPESFVKMVQQPGVFDLGSIMEYYIEAGSVPRSHAEVRSKVRNSIPRILEQHKEDFRKLAGASLDYADVEGTVRVSPSFYFILLLFLIHNHKQLKDYFRRLDLIEAGIAGKSGQGGIYGATKRGKQTNKALLKLDIQMRNAGLRILALSFIKGGAYLSGPASMGSWEKFFSSDEWRRVALVPEGETLTQDIYHKYSDFEDQPTAHRKNVQETREEALSYFLENMTAPDLETPSKQRNAWFKAIKAPTESNELHIPADLKTALCEIYDVIFLYTLTGILCDYKQDFVVQLYLRAEELKQPKGKPEAGAPEKPPSGFSGLIKRFIG